MEAIGGVKDERVIIFIMMLFFAVLFMIAVYMSFRIVFGKWSIKNRKKKVLRRLKELSKNSQKDKVLVLSSDSNGIPTLIATNTTYEFI